MTNPTASEVARIRLVADGLRRIREFESAKMLDAYATMLEAMEKAEPVAVVEQCEPYLDGSPNPMKRLNWSLRNCENELPVGTKLYTHAPIPAPKADQAGVSGEFYERDLQYLIFVDTQFELRGKTDIGATVVQRLIARGWLEESWKNGEIEVSDAGRLVIDGAFIPAPPADQAVIELTCGQIAQLHDFAGFDDQPYEDQTRLMVGYLSKADSGPGMYAWFSECDEGCVLLDGAWKRKQADQAGVSDDALSRAMDAYKKHDGYAVHAPSLRAALEAVRKPVVKSDPAFLTHITANQAKELLNTFGGSAALMELHRVPAGHVLDDEGNPLPEGLYTLCSDCPEEGWTYLGDEDKDAAPRPAEDVSKPVGSEFCRHGRLWTDECDDDECSRYATEEENNRGYVCLACGHVPSESELKSGKPCKCENRVGGESQDNDGWIKWEGGECPVGPDVIVEVKLRNGARDKGIAIFFSWKYIGRAWDRIGRGLGDIIEYRVSK